MVHKGVSKHKLPIEKSKPLETAIRGSNSVSGLIQSEGVPGRMAEKARTMPSGKDRMTPRPD